MPRETALAVLLQAAERKFQASCRLPDAICWPGGSCQGLEGLHNQQDKSYRQGESQGHFIGQQTWLGAEWAAARVLVASFGVWLLVTGRAGTGRTPRPPRLFKTASLQSNTTVQEALGS